MYLIFQGIYKGYNEMKALSCSINIAM